MTDTTITFKKLPAVLATQRTYTLSDAVLYNIFKDSERTPVDVVRHGVRATNNTPPKKITEGAMNENEVRNLQVIDSAKTDYRATALQVEFHISFFDVAKSLSAIAGNNDQALRDSFFRFTDRAKSSEGIKEVSRRFARNILSGRWLWRNRLIADSITTEVIKNGEAFVSALSLELPLNNFNNYSEPENQLADCIAKGLGGKGSDKLTVRATINCLAGGAVEVFPSQNYRDGADSSTLSRSLYVLNKPRKISTEEGPARVGDAAIRDQKVANAIRTIDTWYPSEENNPIPIAIEQYGANLDQQRFFRRGATDNAFSLMRGLNILDENSPNGMFMIACLVRGAVYAGG